MVDDQFEIFGQRLSADGGELAPNDFRISDMGGTADTALLSAVPAVAYNSQDNEYLVVWYGFDDIGGQGGRELVDVMRCSRTVSSPATPPGGRAPCREGVRPSYPPASAPAGGR